MGYIKVARVIDIAFVVLSFSLKKKKKEEAPLRNGTF